MEAMAPTAAVAPTVPEEEMPPLEAMDDDLEAYLAQLGSARSATDPLFN